MFILNIIKYVKVISNKYVYVNNIISLIVYVSINCPYNIIAKKVIVLYNMVYFKALIYYNHAYEYS